MGSCPGSSVAASRRGVAAGAVWGGTLALGMGLVLRAGGSGTPTESQAILWMADRGSGELVGLNRRLTPVVTLELDFPEHVAGAENGAVWVVAGGRLRHVEADGVVTVDEPVGEVRDLEALSGGDVLVLERSGALRRYDPAGRSRLLVDLEGASDLAARDERVLVACEDGWLAQVDVGPHPAVVGLTRRDATLLALAAGSGVGAGWWLLEASGGPVGGSRGEARRLTRLGPDGDPLWSRSVPSGSERLTPSRDGVWLTDPVRGGLVEIGFGADQRAWIELPPALREPLVLIDFGPGILVGAHGALLSLTRGGSVVGSQGGFDDLVAGCRSYELASGDSGVAEPR